MRQVVTLTDLETDLETEGTEATSGQKDRDQKGGAKVEEGNTNRMAHRNHQQDGAPKSPTGWHTEITNRMAHRNHQQDGAPKSPTGWHTEIINRMAHQNHQQDGALKSPTGWHTEIRHSSY